MASKFVKKSSSCYVSRKKMQIKTRYPPIRVARYYQRSMRTCKNTGSAAGDNINYAPLGDCFSNA